MVFTGRGGFGNHSQKTDIPVQAMPVQHFYAPSQKIRTGRGGFGNTVKVADVDIYSSQELLADKKAHEDKSPNFYMIGRGGAGNHVTPQFSPSSYASSVEGQISPYNSTPNHPIKPLTSRLWNKITPAKTR